MNNPRVDAPCTRPSLAVVCLLAIGIATVGIGIAPTTASAVTNPTVTGPITAACSPVCPSPPGPANGIHIPDAFDGGSNLQEFIDDDYTEEEFYFEGTATAFERDPAAPAWDSTGSWTARASTTFAPAAYKSRMLVNRPTDPANFNGIVVVEWFNVTALVDLPPDYGYFRKELRRDGFIFVGVTAQFVGVNGSPALPGFALKAWDPVRYGSLVHPGDSYSYDILSQAAQAIRSPVGVNPLGSSDYVVTGMIADGESQSAGRMTTYVDAIAPLAQVFDGYLIHSRGGAGAGLFASQCTGGSNAGATCTTSTQCPGGVCTVVSGGAVPSPSKIRTDIPPVLVFETETDTAGHFAARQPDGANYRLWEPAGTAHVDDYDYTFFNLNNATSEPSYPPQSCTFQKNMANERYVMNSAILHLSQWINGGTPPPSAPSPINVVGGVIQRDLYNIATGGIRLPEMDVPTQTHQGTGNTGTSFCVLFGRTFPLGSKCVGGANNGAVCISNSACPGGACQAVPLSSLYNTHDGYVTAYTNATNNLQAGGFILPPDAAETIAAAQSSTVGIRCGNGAVEAGEACDDGDIDAGDGCSDTCTVETGYFCSGSPSTCAPICGDNLVTGPEQCDDGSTTAGDGCSATCTVEPGFSCMGNPSTCEAICGDGLVVDGEGCDDGNVAAGDGCSATCTVEVGWSCSGEPSMCAPICGDGLILGTETCDDAVANGTLASCCSTSCQFQPGGTSCDDGNACTTNDACNGIANSCVGGPLDTCNDGNVCTADSCNPLSGCIHDGPARDGFACDDGHVCTQGDVCTNGQCAGTTGADSDGDGYCDNAEVSRGCNPHDFNEIPPQPAAFAGSPVGGVGNFLVTYLVPANGKVSKATDPSCASAGVCAGSGFCSAGKIADPCATNADCNEPANTCRVVANYAAIPDLAVRRPFMLNRTTLSSFEPLTPGCSRKVDVTLDPARSSNVLKINVTGTVGGHVRRDADRFRYR
jgi:cysteine-rich repeat protein